MTKARDNANGGLGLILIKPSSVVNGTDNGKGTVSFSAASSLSVNGVFNSLYENYKIIFNPTAFSATNSAFNIRLRSNGSDATGADYNSERQRNENGSITATRFASQSSFQVGAFNTNGPTRNFKEMNIYSPQLAVTTSFWVVSNYVDNAGSLKTEMNGGYHALSNSYDGFTLILDAGTFTGSLSVYGYNK